METAILGQQDARLGNIQIGEPGEVVVGVLKLARAWTRLRYRATASLTGARAIASVDWRRAPGWGEAPWGDFGWGG